MAERILIIGACGFIGRAVSAALHRSGAAVFGYDLAAHRGDPPAGIDFIDGSVTDRPALSRAVKRIAPTAIVSLAAFSQVSTGLAVSAEADRDAAFAVNVDGLRNVVEAGLEHGGGRIVWSSSTVVLGPVKPGAAAVLDESAPLDPVNTYGLTKALAEQISRYAHDVMGLDIAAVRPTLVLGPDHPYSGVLDPIKRLLAHRPEDGPFDLEWGSHAFDIVHVEDVAAAIAALCRRTERLSAVYHVNGGVTTIGDIVATVRALRPGLDVRLSTVEPDVVYPLIAADRIAAETGVTPRFTPQEIIVDCLKQSNSQRKESMGGIYV